MFLNRMEIYATAYILLKRGLLLTIAFRCIHTGICSLTHLFYLLTANILHVKVSQVINLFSIDGFLVPFWLFTAVHQATANIYAHVYEFLQCGSLPSKRMAPLYSISTTWVPSTPHLWQHLVLADEHFGQSGALEAVLFSFICQFVQDYYGYFRLRFTFTMVGFE